MISIHDSAMERVSEDEIKEILATEKKSSSQSSYFGDYGLNYISEKISEVKDTNKNIRF